jgi:hypothetical protein
MRKCQNIAIESRFADGKWDRFPGLAAELTRVQVDVIVTYTTPALAAQAAKHATGTTRGVLLPPLREVVFERW